MTPGRDPALADKIIAFLNCLPIVHGPAAGQRFHVDPWMERFIRDVYEPVNRAARTDLTPSPTLVSEAGGTWQGYTCSWAHVIELTPDKPVVRIDQIPTSYNDGGAREEGETKSMEGVLIPGQKGKSIRVRYTGDVDATVVYAKVGESYDPVNLPELLTC